MCYNCVSVCVCVVKVEINTGIGYVPDFTDSVLIHRTEIEEINSQIRVRVTIEYYYYYHYYCLMCMSCCIIHIVYTVETSEKRTHHYKGHFTCPIMILYYVKSPLNKGHLH